MQSEQMKEGQTQNVRAKLYHSVRTADLNSGVCKKDNPHLRRSHRRGYSERSPSCRETMQTWHPQKYCFRISTRLAIAILLLLSRHGILRPQPRQLDSMSVDSCSQAKFAIPHCKCAFKNKDDTNLGHYGRSYKRSGLHSHHGSSS
jgi:hypothetical protein